MTNEIRNEEEMSDFVDNAIEDFEESYGDYLEDIWSDDEADSDTLVSAGWGMDEDYGYYGGEE